MVRFCPALERHPLKIAAGTPTILSQISRVFPKPLQANGGGVSHLKSLLLTSLPTHYSSLSPFSTLHKASTV